LLAYRFHRWVKLSHNCFFHNGKSVGYPESVKNKPSKDQCECEYSIQEGWLGSFQIF